MKIISFNINGVRARLHQLQALIDKHQPDVIGLQEIKVDNDMFPYQSVQQMGYTAYVHGQKGHYGVALLTKLPLVDVQYGFPTDADNAQRRMIIGRYQMANGEIIHILNGYFPQGENRTHPVKFPYKQKFYQDLKTYLQTQFQPNDAVIVLGDMNISTTDQDIGIGETNKLRWLRTGKCSFLPEERQWINGILDWGLVDTWRLQNTDENGVFSWFDYRSRGFDDNRGLRIDLILATLPLIEKLKCTGVDYQLRGLHKPSDHAPVWACFEP